MTGSRSLVEALEAELSRLEVAEAFLRDLDRASPPEPEDIILHRWHPGLRGSVDKWRLDYHSPEVFEWLCYTLIANNRTYAGRGLMRGGRTQDGMDFYAWDQTQSAPSLVAFEVKRRTAKPRNTVAPFRTSELNETIQRFLDNRPPPYCKRFVIMVSGELASGTDRAKQDWRYRLEIEHGIELEVWTQAEILQLLGRTPSVAARVFDDERVFRELCGGYYTHLKEVAGILAQERRTEEQRAEINAARATGAVLRTDTPPSWRDHRISLTLIPPTLRTAGSGSLLVHTPDHTGAVITLGHEEILQRLWPGRESGSDGADRPFVVGPVPKDRAERVVLRFASADLHVEQETVDSLARAVDALLPLYLDGLRALEHEARAEGHRFLHEADGGPEPILCSVPLWLWHDILTFTRAHDFACGTGRWFIFDAAPAFLKVYVPPGRAGAGEAGYRVIIRARPVTLEPYAVSPENAAVDLVWEPPSSLNTLPVGPGGYWPCDFTLHWLRTELVPAVRRRYRRFGKRRRLIDILSGEAPAPDQVIDHREDFTVPLPDDPTSGDLLRAVERLQYEVHGWQKPAPLPLRRHLWSDLVDRCMEIAPLAPSSLIYPASKLGMSGEAATDVTQFLHEGRMILERHAASIVSDRLIDLALRALIGLLRDGRPDLPDPLRHRLADSLRPLVTLAEEDLLVARHLPPLP